MLRQNARQLVKHTSIYSLGWIANACAGVLLLPVYTRYMSVEDYGAVDLVQQTNMVFRIVFIACFTYSVGRFFYDSKTDRERALTVSTSALNVIIVAACATSLCLLFRLQLSALVFGDAKHCHLIDIGAAIMFFDMAYAGLTYQYLVGKKSIRFVLLNLIKLFTAISANLFFIVGLKLGAIGMLYGNLCSLVPVCVIALASCVKTYGYRIDWELTKAMVKFGSPMIPAGLLAVMMHNADRFMLRPLGSLEQVGIFMMGLQFPSMLNAVLLTSFNSIWGGAVMFQVSKQEDRDHQTRKLATYCMTGYLLMQTTLGVFGGTLLKLLADPKFMPSADIIPIACIGYGFHAFYTFMTTKAFTDSNPKRMVIAYAVPVAVKLALSFALVASYGYMASVWIMAGTYAVFALTCYLLFQKTSPRFEFGRLGFLFATCIGTLLLAHMISFEDEVTNFTARTLLIAGLFAVLWFGPYFRTNEKRALQVELQRAVARVCGKTASIEGPTAG